MSSGLKRGNRVCRVPMTVLVPGGSTTANLFEASRTTSVKRKQGV